MKDSVTTSCKLSIAVIISGRDICTTPYTSSMNEAATREDRAGRSM